jgi:hypothetical protein
MTYPPAASYCCRPATRDFSETGFEEVAFFASDLHSNMSPKPTSDPRLRESAPPRGIACAGASSIAAKVLTDRAEKS